MKDAAHLMDVKNKLNKKRPKFMREGSQNSLRIGKKWRKPRGLHSKMRHHFAGHRCKVNIGYRSPAKLRCLDREGLKLKKIETMKELNNLDPKSHKIILSASVSIKKKILLLGKIIEKDFKVYFCKDPVKKIEELKNKLKTKKTKKDQKKKAKKNKKESKKKPELEKKVKQVTQEISAEEKKKEDQKEMEKIITKREQK